MGFTCVCITILRLGTISFSCTLIALGLYLAWTGNGALDYLFDLGYWDVAHWSPIGLEFLQRHNEKRLL